MPFEAWHTQGMTNFRRCSRDKKVIPLKALEQWLAMIWESDREADQAAGLARLSDAGRLSERRSDKSHSSYSGGSFPLSHLMTEGQLPLLTNP